MTLERLTEAAFQSLAEGFPEQCELREHCRRRHRDRAEIYNPTLPTHRGGPDICRKDELMSETSSTSPGSPPNGAAARRGSWPLVSRISTTAAVLVIIGALMLGMLLAASTRRSCRPRSPRSWATSAGGAHIAWVVTAYLLAATVSTPLWGKLGRPVRAEVLLPGVDRDIPHRVRLLRAQPFDGRAHRFSVGPGPRGRRLDGGGASDYR